MQTTHVCLQKLLSPMQQIRRLKTIGIMEMSSAKKAVNETQDYI